MFTSLILAAALTGQAPAANPYFVPNPSVQHTIAKKRAAEARRQAQRRNRAIQEQYAAQQRMLEAERLAPLVSQVQRDQANTYYQYQAGAAMRDLGMSARQNAATLRMRSISEFGPGYWPALDAPRYVSPAEVINRQLGR